MHPETAPENIGILFLLFVAFQIKHFLADFPLQFPYMLRKGKADWGFVKPLASHCMVHASLSAVIIAYWNPSLLWLAGLDFMIHFFMDRIKSGPKYLGRFNNKGSSAYWNCFGMDQLVHHFTNYFIIWMLWTN